LPGNSLTAVRLSKAQNISNVNLNNLSTSFDSSCDNLSQINFNKRGLENSNTTTTQVQILQPGAAFSCSSSANRTPPPPLKLREIKHQHSSSNSNLDLNITTTQSIQQQQQQHTDPPPPPSSLPLLIQKQRPKTPQPHMQHKHLDRMTSKRALFKNMHQNEALVKLKTSINNENENYDHIQIDNQRQKSTPTSPTSLSRYNQQHQQHHYQHQNNSQNSKNSSLLLTSGQQNIRNRRRLEQHRRSNLGGGLIKSSKSKSLDVDDQDDGEDNENVDGYEDKSSLTGELIAERHVEFSPEIIEAADKVTYITNHIKSENDYEEVN